MFFFLFFMESQTSDLSISSFSAQNSEARTLASKQSPSVCMSIQLALGAVNFLLLQIKFNNSIKAIHLLVKSLSLAGFVQAAVITGTLWAYNAVRGFYFEWHLLGARD